MAKLASEDDPYAHDSADIFSVLVYVSSVDFGDIFACWQRDQIPCLLAVAKGPKKQSLRFVQG